MTGLVFFFFCGDSAIVGLQTGSSIDFLSDETMKPGVRPRREGGSRPWDAPYNPPGEEDDIKGQFWP